MVLFPAPVFILVVIILLELAHVSHILRANGYRGIKSVDFFNTCIILISPFFILSAILDEKFIEDSTPVSTNELILA